MMGKFFLPFLVVLCLAGAARGLEGNASPVDLLQQGLEAMLDDRYDDAVRDFQGVLKLDRGNVAAQRGLKGAQEKRREAVEKRRAQEGPALDAARKAVDRLDWAEAAERLEGVLSRQPDHPEALALREKIRGRMAKQLARSKPQSGDWYYAQGLLSFTDRDWLKAVDSWNQVVAFNPDQVGLLAKIDAAKEKLKRQEQENKISFLQTTAFEDLRKNDYAEAVRKWKALLELDPENVQAKEGIVEAQKALDEQNRRGRQEEVQRLSEQAMDAYIERNPAKSVALWHRVLELDPDSTLARDYLRRIGGSGGGEAASSGPTGYDKAMRLMADGRLSEAIEYLERYAGKYPGDQKARSALDEAKAKQKILAEKSYQDGLLAYSQGDAQGAIAQWQTALRADPDYQRARQAIIKAMAEQKKRSAPAGK
jgi:outer membrane protein assembly factor BamD (BamD/ComL family)